MLRFDSLFFHLFDKTVCIHNDLVMEPVQILDAFSLNLFKLVNFIAAISRLRVHFALNMWPYLFKCDYCIFYQNRGKIK